MTKVRQYFVLPALPIAAFLACTIFLQTKKTPWVDECYTYYGITHDNWGGFVDSICSGVNFSPPLYFLLNWIIQLEFQMPIDALRIESALWISLGSFLIFLRCEKTFGSLSAFLGCTMVLLQSNLLNLQALEARHYGMFYACSAWILLLFPHNQQFSSNKHKTLYFLAHLALIFTHYLGIVFSVLTGITRFCAQRKKGIAKALPIPEISSCILALPLYLVLLVQQSSHLGNWAKPNNLSSLLEICFDSLLPLTMTIPILLFLLFIKSGKKRSTPDGLPLIITLAIIWCLTPLAFWIISHVSTLNLFKDRYFIPKEAAVMVLISYFFNKIIPVTGPRGAFPTSKVITMGGTFVLCISLFLLSSKRTLFGFEPHRSYHHKLLLNEETGRIPLAKLYSGDHLFFPNHYSKTSDTMDTLIVSSKRIQEVYLRFNSAIETQVPNELVKEPFVLIVDKERFCIDDIFTKYSYSIKEITLPSNTLIKAYTITPVKDSL